MSGRRFRLGFGCGFRSELIKSFGSWIRCDLINSDPTLSPSIRTRYSASSSFWISTVQVACLFSALRCAASATAVTKSLRRATAGLQLILRYCILRPASSPVRLVSEAVSAAFRRHPASPIFLRRASRRSGDHRRPSAKVRRPRLVVQKVPAASSAISAGFRPPFHSDGSGFFSAGFSLGLESMKCSVRYGLHSVELLSFFFLEMSSEQGIDGVLFCYLIHGC